MAEDKKIQFQLTHRIKDDLYEAEHLAAYDLYLQVGTNLLRLCVNDPAKNRCLLLEDYTLRNVRSTSQVIEQLELLYDDHHVLKAGFWKSIKLAIKSNEFSLIPFSLFDRKYTREYLSINCQLKSESEVEIMYCKQSSTDAVNIFSADKKIVDWFRNKYPGKNISIIHHTCPLIEGLMTNGYQEPEPAIYLQLEAQYMTIVVKKQKNLLFCNTFYYNTPDDLLYFVMFVFDQLKLNPEKNQVIVMGEIGIDSPVLSKIKKYIRHVSFGEKPSSMYFGYHFDDVLQHRYFDLYSMHLCE